jgi:hypothetical protein
MKIKIIVFALFFTALIANSQSIQFQRTYGFTTHDFLRAKQTPDRGYILYGARNYNTPNEDLMIVKTDSFGNVMWSKIYGTSSYDYLWDLQVLKGGYLVAASNSSTSQGLILKLDLNGNIIWSKKDILAIASTLTADSNYVIASPDNTFTGFLTKLDTDANVIWRIKYDLPGSLGTHAIKQTLDGGYVITGDITGFSGSPDISIVKVDSMGTIQWAKRYGGNSFDWYPDIDVTFDGGFVVVATTQSFGAGSDDALLMKLDASGNLQWARTFGGPMNDGGNYIKKTFGSLGYIFTGSTPGFSASDDSATWGWMKSYIIKVDINGNFQWARRYGLGGPSDIAATIWQTQDAGYLFSGSTSAWGAGGLDGWLIKTDNMGLSGCYDWPTLPSVSIPPVMDTVVAFTQSPDTLTPTAGNFLWDSIIAPFTTIECTTDTNWSGNAVHELPSVNAIFIYPNPVQDKLTLHLKNTHAGSSIEIFNSLGQFMLRSSISSSRKELDVSHLPPGLYLVRVIAGADHSFTTRFIKN